MAPIVEILKTWVLAPGVVKKLNALYQIKQHCFRSADEKWLLNENKNLKGCNKGKRCFILGAGASIKNQNLKLLIGEFVLSVSNTFVHEDYPAIEPQYHILPPIMQGHHDYYSKEKFVSWLQEMEARTFNAEMFFHIRDRKLIEDNHLFKNRIVHWVDYCPWDGSFDAPIDLSKIPQVWSVSEAAIAIAIYLGFEEIYVIGVDHDWFNGPLVYFFDPAKDHKLQPSDKLLQEHGIDAEFQMRRHADIFKKYKYFFSVHPQIYNANSNPNHYLDVFPKVDFDSLFDVGNADIRSLVHIELTSEIADSK